MATLRVGEYVNQAGLDGHYEAVNHHGEQIMLDTTRMLNAGDVIDLRESVLAGREFFR